MLRRLLLSLRARPLLRRLLLTASAFAPIVLLGAISSLLLPQGLLDDIAQPGSAAQEAPGIVAGLAGDLTGIAAALIAAGWLINRRTVVKAARTAHLLLPVMISALGMAVIFTGLRTKYAIAYVVSTQPFELARVSGFLEVQASLLAMQVMLLAMHGVHYAIFRTERYGD